MWRLDIYTNRNETNSDNNKSQNDKNSQGRQDSTMNITNNKFN